MTELNIIITGGSEVRFHRRVQYEYVPSLPETGFGRAERSEVVQTPHTTAHITFIVLT